MTRHALFGGSYRSPEGRAFVLSFVSFFFHPLPPFIVPLSPSFRAILHFILLDFGRLSALDTPTRKRLYRGRENLSPETSPRVPRVKPDEKLSRSRRIDKRGMCERRRKKKKKQKNRCSPGRFARISPVRLKIRAV